MNNSYFFNSSRFQVHVILSWESPVDFPRAATLLKYDTKPK